MLNRRVFLKFLSFLTLVAPYSGSGAISDAAEKDTVVIPLDKLRSPWDTFSFTFGTAAIPGLAVRLPSGAITVVSRICPHQKCYTDLIKDTAQVLRETTFEPSAPVLVCPCHASVFDLSDGGNVLFGPAPRAPDRFKFRIEGEKIIITGLEG